jgi:hypothetical protein
VHAGQRDLAAALAGLVPNPRRAPLHVPVTVNKGKRLSREFTQRTRSFLFASQAAVVARALGIPRVRAYENGIVSLNLPISPQLLGGRASRTTHPRVLNSLGRLFGLLFGMPLEVQNPFLWKTKADVLRQVRAAGHGLLCATAVSCSHTMAATRQYPHCGRCSQCVDRRVTALAAGLGADEDPPHLYRSDVLTGTQEGPELTLIERYLGTALRMRRMAEPTEFVRAFAEVTEVLGHVGQSAVEASRRVFDLYRRHAKQVFDALTQEVSRRSGEIVGHAVPPNTLLALACGRRAGEVGAPEGPAAPSDGAPTADPLVVDERVFTAYWEGIPCDLGWTMEFRLLARLNRDRGHFLNVQVLIDDVWDRRHTSRNTVQATVSNLRRRLREDGLTGVIIEPTREHYRLLVQRATSQVSA